MSKYILLECNRERAIDKSFNSSITDTFKNKWTNQVSNSGILVKAGDVLTIDETIINSKGADSEVMEFRGEPNENNIIDNKAQVEFSYYINHNGSNTGNFPMIGHKTYRGQGNLITPFVIATDGGNYPQATPIVKIAPYSEANFLSMISKRSLGEVWLGGDGSNYNGQTEFINPISSDDVMPQSLRVFKMTTTQRGGGLGASGTASNINSGFIEGTVYDTTTTDSNGAGMRIRVDSTITIGDIPNIIENFTIIDMGTSDYTDANATITIPLTAAEGTSQIYTINSPLGSEYTSSDISKFDGSKYFPLNVGYSGLCLFNDTQINNNQPAFDISADYDVDKLELNPSKRTNNVILETPKGFSTPSTISNILTEQLARPDKIDRNFNKGDFLDMEGFEFFHLDPITDFTNTGKPNIIASKVYQPHSANFFNNGKNVPKKASLTGKRTTFYQSIAYKEPERIISLQPAFKQFEVQAEPYIAGNEIQTATGTQIVGVNTFGDFGRAGTGEFGPHPTILADPLIAGVDVNMDRGNIIVSNILFTKSNIQKISKMKGAEKYMGDLSRVQDTTTDNYKEYLSVNLDVGMYDDELSTQGILTKTDVGELTDQRTKFATKAEAIAANNCEVSVGNNRIGFQRDLTKTANDGQQLSNMWVKSRYDKNSMLFDRNNISTDFQTNFAILGLGSKKMDTTGTDINQVFGEGHTLADGTFISIEEMNSWAEEYDVAVLPLNVPINPADATQNQDIKKFNIPFVCFVIACNYGTDAVFDNIKQFEATTLNHWRADFDNFKFGQMFGFDPSFTRNKAVVIYNNQLGVGTNSGDPKNYLNYVNLGAVNPLINFDANFSRFSISGLNTPLFIGNGLTTDDTLEFTPSDNPQQQSLTINGSHQIIPSQSKDIGTVPTGHNKRILRIGQYGKARQEYGTILDSQSGCCIESISVFDNNNNLVKFGLEELKSQNEYLYHNTLFDKMGFDLETLLPKFGSQDAFFRNPSIQLSNKTFEIAKRHTIKPMTTGADLTANDCQTFSVNEESAPLFDLGGDTFRQIKPDATQGEITATRLASKFDFSYLCVYSSLISEGTDTIYIGGSDNQSKLSCMTYLTRENNQSDFFYQGEKGFNFTATKDFTITDITTDIRLPNGERPILNSSSTIIYKIEKPLRSLPSNAQPIAQPTRHTEEEKK
tara:strand:+ start:2041 stop:5559 length:3519 start_codon:yes stop_codon:yes gene_type:complete